MNRYRLVIATTAVALAGLVGGTAAIVQAGGDPAVGKQVLDAMCVEDKGAPVFTPYAIARCQEARDSDGFQIEQLVCEGLLDGTFESAPAIGRPNRTNWFCFPGATTA